MVVELVQDIMPTPITMEVLEVVVETLMVLRLLEELERLIKVMLVETLEPQVEVIAHKPEVAVVVLQV